MDIGKLARNCGGVKTWGFSQSDFSVWRYYRTFGICAALSAEWINYHAHDGSLANVLGGGGVGPLNVAKLKEIALLHATASSGVGGAQAEQLELWLKMHDLISVNRSCVKRFIASRTQREVTQASYRSGEIRAGGKGANCPNIENDLVNAMTGYNTCYVRLNFGGSAWGTEAGHAVAAWLGQPTWGRAGDALFFDPNHGEFWFERKADFFRFFPLFYRAAYRSFPLYFDQYWEVLPCALRAW